MRDVSPGFWNNSGPEDEQLYGTLRAYDIGLILFRDMDQLKSAVPLYPFHKAANLLFFILMEYMFSSVTCLMSTS